MGFKGTTIIDWQSPPLFVHNPLLKVPDFWSSCFDGGFIVDPEQPCFQQMPLGGELDLAGELLPLDTEGGLQLSALNVTNVVNALDKSRTKWSSTDNGRHMYVDVMRGGPDAYQFHEDRLPESCLFKLPQNAASAVFCIERTGDPATEFKACVEKLGLTGLQFRLIWESA